MTRDVRIETLVAAWKSSQAQGMPVTIEELCRDCPELLLEVRRCIEVIQENEDFVSRAPNETPRQFELPLGSGQRQADAEVAARQNAQTLLTGTPAAPHEVIAGRYKLLQQIGEGGMGVVYMAEQITPVHRFVAVKIIKPGMDSREVITRFEAERQALALMDHHNIAKVLDAGTTSQGRPYFVMELVKGVPITRYCDEHHLFPQQRLELFVDVCHAVQHAHQKGIIHRDLKPSNVLVAQYDGKPIPKVIDFGVAKATGQKLTDNTMFTAFGAIVGTLEYMSPEQAQFNQMDIDTRSDIYSLGVILYELLTGSTPFDRKRMKNAALMEILRSIREEEPPRPSTRLGTTEQLPSIAANRGLEPRKLSGIVRGDLDWIVMKALDKDRNRRYETANGMALDIQRYLSDEPVSACPPSAVYRLRKLAMKHRGLFFAGCVVTASVLIGLVGLAISRQLISQERDATTIALRDRESALQAARAAEALEFEQRQTSERRRQEAERERERADRNLKMARDAVDKLLTRAAEDLRGLPQMERVRRALLDDALKFYQGFLKENRDDPAIQFETGMAALRIGNIHCFLGQSSEGLSNYLEAQGIFKKIADDDPKNPSFREQLAECHHRLGDVHMGLHHYDASVAELEQSIATWDALIKDWPNNPVYLYRSAQVNLQLEGNWRNRYWYGKSAPHRARYQQLRDELVRRFPDFPLSSDFKAGAVPTIFADQASPDQTDDRGLRPGRDYGSLPHDPETLQLYEQEIRKAIAYWEQQVAAHPGVPNYEMSFVKTCGYLASVLCAQNRTDETEPLVDRAAEQLTQLVLRYPENVEYQVSAAWSDNGRGHGRYLAGRKAEAREFYRRAISTAKAVSERFPDERRHHVHVVGLLIYCPDVELRDPQRAIEEERRIMELGGTGADRAELAIAQSQAGLYEEALQSILKAKEDHSGPSIDLVEAIVRLNLNQKDEAQRLYKRAIDAIDQTTNRRWYTPQYRFMRTEFDARMGIGLDPAPNAKP